MPNHINLTRSARPVRKSGLVISLDEGNTQLRFPYRNTSFCLNESATLIWQLCDGTRRFGELCKEIAEHAGAESSNVENEVSEIVSSLIGKGLIELNKSAPKPVLRISFIGYPDDFNIADNFFLNLFVNWFDLLLTRPTENVELLVSWGSVEAREMLEDVVVSCLVDEKCQQKPEGYDLLFRPDECQNETEVITLNLPQDYLQNPIPPLNETDRASLDSMFSRDTPEQKRLEVDLTVKKKLTIGMATFDDYDGVYFSVQAIRMFHPEVTDETDILVIDNNPGGSCSKALRDLKNAVPGYRYISNDELKGTAVRDFVFHEAETDYVMCVDSHVFIEPGAIRKLIDYFDAHPDTNDLLQGPLVYDNLKDISTHFEPVWRKGMFGIWGSDERGENPDAPAFEIPMQGLGLAACRKRAWLGYNHRFTGFGGEEGYIHQKFRNAGARTLCLPFLRWMHRFERPMGTRYTNVWEDRIRNYLIGFEEVGLDTQQVIDHFSQEVNEPLVNRVASFVELEKNNPFDYFDAIYCINLERQAGRWDMALERFDKLGIRYRVRRFPAIDTPKSHHIGCTLSHRRIVAEAKKKGYKNILVFEDDVIFHENTLEHLRNSITELKKQKWNVFYLGGMKWMKLGRKPYSKLPDCEYLERPEGITCSHALAYNSNFYDKLLDDVPDTVEDVEKWISECYPAIDQYLPAQESLLVMSPVIASQPPILKEEDEAMRDGFA